MRKPMIIARQGRRPSGLLGMLVAGIMARETAPENDTALRLLDLQPADDLLELGSGHGATLARAARLAPEGRLCGVDFSPVMHRHAMARNRALVGEGRLSFHLGPTDRLPFADGSFDKAFAVHTVYFWEDPAAHLAEARRVLRPGGRFVLGFRPGEDPGFEAAFPPEVYRIRPEAEVLAAMERAGLTVREVAREAFGPRQVSFAVAAA